MTSYQQSLLVSIDETSKKLQELVIEGVKCGIQKEVMEAHCRAYFTQNMGRELYRMFQKKQLDQPVDLFTTFKKQDNGNS